MAIGIQVDSDPLHLIIPVAPHQSQQVFLEVILYVEHFTWFLEII